MTSWNVTHIIAANAEGWDLFETGGGDHAPLELQRNDTMDETPDGEPILDDDTQAWELVVARAEAGSAFHRLVLDVLWEESIGEWFDVVNGASR